MKTDKLLLIDDDTELGELLVEFLASEGFSLELAHSGEEGLQKLAENRYDLILLDVMMPGMSGLDVLKTMRTHNTVPVLMLTAKGDELDKVLGLELGADDYLPKPYSHRELLARIRALLRRVEMDHSKPGPAVQPVLSLGRVTLDTRVYKAMIDKRDLELTQTEFKVLQTLMERAGQVVTKNELYQTVLGRPLEPYDRSIDMHVSNVRKKMLLLADDCRPIKTLRGVGYQFIAD
ncbi:response regulator transcription factor [Salinispirillum sp. LH 10-3-1]|uniref:Response regulator transcription factor n=1 Tax=Salinispirillum sp. LH 10-3-1 TaxID=2952525 RepID=A0AB38YG64_9GAMM